MRGIWEKYYSEASAIIYVVDSSDKDRINEAYYAYNAIFDNENDNNSNNSSKIYRYVWCIYVYVYVCI